VNLLQTLRDGYAIRTPGQAFITEDARLGVDRKCTILIPRPSLQPITIEVAFKAKDVRNGDILWTRKTVTAISAEPLPHVSDPIHEPCNLFLG